MTSDDVLIKTTLFLGFAALAAAVFGPYLAEVVKGWFLAPRLKILWNEVSPHCILTYFTFPPVTAFREPVYYFRFQATNEGKTQARICEAVLENLWTYDSARRPHQYPDFAPRNLGFETDKPTAPVGINPHRKIYCAFGHISSATHQKNGESPNAVDIKGNWVPELLRFSLEGNAITNGQPTWLVPGKYAIQVTIFSENASPETGYFIIDWSGRWQDDPATMFNECVIQYTSKRLSKKSVNDVVQGVVSSDKSS